MMFLFTLANPLLPVYATNHTKKKPIQYKKYTNHSVRTKKMKDDLPSPAIEKTDVVAEDNSGFSGQMTLASNYIFRGISQTANNPAIQGSITYTFPIGLYANVWGSNVNFPAPDGRTATIEIDTILGFKGKIIEDLTYDINVDRYHYPRARSANYNELNTLFNYKIIQLGVSYSANYAGTHATGIYYNGALIYSIPSDYLLNIQDISLQAGMGHYSLAKSAGNSYNDYIVAINKKINSTYAVTVQWTGTNGRAQMSPLDDNHIVGLLTASF